MDPRARSFDRLAPGDRFVSAPRIIRREDIDRFSDLSGDRTELHTDDAWAAAGPLGGVVAHGALALAVATGLAYDLGVFRGTVLAFRSLTASFDRPVYPGDEVRLELTVSALEPPRRPDRGRAEFEMVLRNQEGRKVLTGTWTLLLKRGES